MSETSFTAPVPRAAADDRALLVIGAASGASIGLARLAAAPASDGTSWLMVLVHAAVMAQGTAALMWLARRGLRWLVGRVTASHAVREAYAQEDTWTYAVFLLTLATAVGVQLITPVQWVLVLLFLAAQGVVLRRAVRRGATRASVASRRTGGRSAWLAAAVAAGAAGAAGMAGALGVVVWMRQIEQQLGDASLLSAVIAAALWTGLSVGVRWGAGTPPRADTSRPMAGAGAGAALVLWMLASMAMMPRVGAALVVTSWWVAALGVFAVFFVPALLLGLGVGSLAVAAAPSMAPRETPLPALVAYALLGAAAGSLLAADVLFAFTGLCGAAWCAAAVFAWFAMLSAWLGWRGRDAGDRP